MAMIAPNQWVHTDTLAKSIRRIFRHAQISYQSANEHTKHHIPPEYSRCPFTYELRFRD
jgi:hypothetical protein